MHTKKDPNPQLKHLVGRRNHETKFNLFPLMEDGNWKGQIWKDNSIFFMPDWEDCLPIVTYLIAECRGTQRRASEGDCVLNNLVWSSLLLNTATSSNYTVRKSCSTVTFFKCLAMPFLHSSTMKLKQGSTPYLMKGYIPPKFYPTTSQSH